MGCWTRGVLKGFCPFGMDDTVLGKLDEHGTPSSWWGCQLGPRGGGGGDEGTRCPFISKSPFLSERRADQGAVAGTTNIRVAKPTAMCCQWRGKLGRKMQGHGTWLGAE